MDCCTVLIAVVFFIFTTLLWLVGGGITGYAIYSMIEYDYLDDATDFNILSYVLISVTALGVLLVFMGLLGSCGTCCRSKCLLYLFAILLSVLIVAEIAICSYAFVKHDDVEDSVKDGLLDSVNDYLQDNKTLKAWNDIQSVFKCCGPSNGPSDWDKIIDSLYIPESCCKDDNCGLPSSEDCKPAFSNITNTDNAQCVLISAGPYYDQGCGDKVVNTIEDNLVVVGAILIGLIFTQALGVFCAIWIGKSSKHNDQSSKTRFV